MSTQVGLEQGQSLRTKHWSGVAIGELARGVRGAAVLATIGIGLGAAEFAVVAIIGAVHTLGRIFGTLGMASAALRHFSMGPWTRHDDARLVRVLGTILMGALAYVALIAVALPLFLTDLFPFVSWDVWLWGLALFPLTAIDHVVPYVFRARRRSTYFGAFFIAELVVGVAAAAWAGLIVRDLTSYYVALLGGKAVMMGMLAMAWAHASARRPAIEGVPRASLTTMLRFGMSTLVVPFGVLMVTLGDRAVLGSLSTPETLGAYAAVAGFAVALWSLPQLVYFGLYAQIVETSAKGDRHALASVIRGALRSAIPLLVAGAFVLGVAAMPSLRLVFGETPGLPSSVVWLLALAAIVGRLSAPMQYVLEAHDRGWYVQATWIGAGLVNVALNVAVVPLWGAAGAAFSSTLVFGGLLAILTTGASRHVALGEVVDAPAAAWLAGFAAACLMVLVGGGPADLPAATLLATTVALFLATLTAALILGPAPWRNNAPTKDP